MIRTESHAMRNCNGEYGPVPTTLEKSHRDPCLMRSKTYHRGDLDMGKCLSLHMIRG